MRGRDYLDLAREIVGGGTERHWRGASGRAYYALFLEGREALARWGFVAAPRDNAHHFVRQHFLFPSDADLKKIGYALDHLGRLRALADCDLSVIRAFTSDAAAKDAIQKAADSIALLDAIEADPARLATAIAAIKAAFP
jgi:hypothetical protein